MADNILNDNENSGNKLKLPVLTLRDALTREVNSYDYVLPSLPRGKVGMLAAAGGTGKSFWTLQACIQVTTSGCCNFDLSGAEMDGGAEKVGSALIVSLEDEMDDLTHRLQSIQKYWNTEETQKQWIDDIADVDFFQMLPLSGLGLSLFNDYCDATDTARLVYKHAKTMHNLRLIVVDTLRRSHDGDENSNGQMSKVLRLFEKIGKGLNCSVLLVHHENKAALKDSDAGSSALRGASAIVDNARWVMRMQIMTQSEASARNIDDDERRAWIRVTNEKTNYGPIQPAKWLKRNDLGVLIKAEPPAKAKDEKGKGGVSNGWK